jgi:hypothetical protein
MFAIVEVYPKQFRRHWLVDSLSPIHRPSIAKIEAMDGAPRRFGFEKKAVSEIEAHLRL